MAIVKTKLDLGNPPRLSEATKTRLDRLTDDELTANALSDPDNPLLTDQELRRSGSSAGREAGASGHRAQPERLRQALPHQSGAAEGLGAGPDAARQRGARLSHGD